jgi:hypothetical protein
MNKVDVKAIGKSVLGAGIATALLKIIGEQIDKSPQLAQNRALLMVGASGAVGIAAIKFVPDVPVKTGAVVASGLVASVNAAKTLGMVAVTNYVPVLAGDAPPKGLPMNSRQDLLDAADALFPEESTSVPIGLPSPSPLNPYAV